MHSGLLELFVFATENEGGSLVVRTPTVGFGGEVPDLVLVIDSKGMKTRNTTCIHRTPVENKGEV